MRTLLVDSDETLRTNLWNLLKLYQNFALEGEADTAEAAVSFVQQHPVDVIFINHQPPNPAAPALGTGWPICWPRPTPMCRWCSMPTRPIGLSRRFAASAPATCCCPLTRWRLQAQVNRLRYVFDLQQTKREAANRSLLIKTRIGYQLTPVSDILFVERSNAKPHCHPVRRRDSPAGLHDEPVGTNAGGVRLFTGVTSPLSSTCPRFPSSGRTAAAKPTPSSLTAMTARSCSAATNTPNCSPC